MASSNNGYWSRSYGLLTRDQGWIKPLLVMAAARMVPIIGPFGADGYALEWARLTSWGVDSSPKQKNVDIGACIGSGARAFVVALGYGLVIALVSLVFRAIFGVALGGVFNILAGALCGVLVTIAKLRATIYQSIGAGYQLNRLSDMVKRDSNGVLHIIGLNIVLGLIVGLASAILIGTVLAANFAGFVREVVEYEMYGYVDEYYLASLFLSALAGSLPALMVLTYLIMIAASFTSLIITTAVGLWMRQFDVRNWGQSSDPLPGSEPGYPANATGYQQGGYALTSGYDAPASDVTSYQSVAPQPSEPQDTFDYQPISAPVSMPTAGDVAPDTGDSTVQESGESVVAPARTFSLEDAADDTPVFLQPVVEAEPDAHEAPAEFDVPDSEPTIPVSEPVPMEETPEPMTEPEESEPVAAELEHTTDEILEQVEAAIHEADMTLPENDEPDVSVAPEEPEAPRTFSLDDFVSDESDNETAAEPESSDEDEGKPVSDEVITRVIPLGGAQTEQEE